MSQSAGRRSSRGGWILITTVALAVSACTGGSATPVPTASPSPVVATPSATPSPEPSAATVEPTEGASAAPSGGPVDYAAWVERQGFGGSSGLHQLLNEVQFVQRDAFTITLFDLDTGARLADHLAGWLDQNPPTACWADYHAAVRAALGTIHDGYAAAHDAVAGGHGVPADVATSLVTETQAAFDMAPPAGC
jgi:hypothetical protein